MPTTNFPLFPSQWENHSSGNTTVYLAISCPSQREQLVRLRGLWVVDTHLSYFVHTKRTNSGGRLTEKVSCTPSPHGGHLLTIWWAGRQLLGKYRTFCVLCELLTGGVHVK